MSTILSWIIFLPLLTAGVILILPSSWRTLIKMTGVVGALVTFILACYLARDYTRAEADPSSAAGPARSADAVLNDLRALQLASLDAQTRQRVEQLLPAPGQAPRALTDVELAALGPYGKQTWEELAELTYAARVPTATRLRFIEFKSWIPIFKINYIVGTDGLSLPLIWLTALLGVICLVYSWTIDKGTKAYYMLFLILQTGLSGVFAALDFFLFYVFWEVVLLPMYFLIGVWGGPNRIYAAIKFFIYTLVGSVLMLLAMLVMFFATEPHTFNMLTLTHLLPATASYELQWWLFMGLFIGFAIKVPIFPFHTWLPDAHVEAPTAISVVLAGVLLKMGGYGFFRFSYPMLPAAALETKMIWFIAILGMINIVYGAFCALAQKDFKKLVAYSSVSHMGYVMLGLAAFSYAGIDGAALQMFNHGVSSAMLFLIVGVIYDRAHHRDLDRFGGIGVQMPWYTGLATIGFFASLGLPGLNGFIGEALVFIGAWDRNMGLITAPNGINAPWIVYVSLLGVVLAAVYILWTIQRVYLIKPVEERHHPFPEINFRECVSLVPLAILCIAVGVFPHQTILKHIDPSLRAMTDMVRAAVSK